MKDSTKKLREINELLDEIKPYSGYLIDLLERRIKVKEFRMYKYREEDGESYYNEVVALKKTVNVLKFSLGIAVY